MKPSSSASPSCFPFCIPRAKCFRIGGMAEYKLVRGHHTNDYLVHTADGWLMVDNDWPGRFIQTAGALKRAGVRMADVKYLFNTHYHVDHAGLSQELKKQGATLIILDTQLPHIKVDETYSRDPGMAAFQPITMENVVVISAADSRSYLNKIGLRGEILSTPGHSPDSAALIVDGLGAFVGDMPPFEYLPMFRNAELDSSWRNVLAHDPPMIFPAHPEPFVPDLTLMPQPGYLD